MGNVNFISIDSIEDEVAVSRNNHDTRIRLVDFATLVWRVRQIERAIDQARDNP